MKDSRWRDDPDIVAIREGARRWRQTNGIYRWLDWCWEDGFRIPTMLLVYRDSSVTEPTISRRHVERI